MEIPLGGAEKIKITQHVREPSSKQVDACDAYLVLLREDAGEKGWPDFPYSDLLQRRARRAGLPSDTQPLLVTDLPNDTGTRLVAARAKSATSTFELLTLARKMVEAMITPATRRVLVHCVQQDAGTEQRAMESVLSAILAATAQLPEFKRGKPDSFRLHQVSLFGLTRRVSSARIVAESEGNHLARWLTALPGNELTPGRYRKYVARLARENGWRMQFFDTKSLREKKAGAFLAVAQASPSADAGIVHLRYRPGKSGERPRLALVGKGICFDTGGVNVKPARYMNGMQGDMQGSAVALGTLLALTRLKAGYPVDCWLALAENHVGPKAYKPGDVIRAVDGTHVEINHTDAEGRIVLADTLALAARKKPDLVIDYATLTGACVHALSERYSGVFSNRDDLLPALLESGRSSGERVWPFPLDSDYDEDLKSEIADIKQCTLEGGADHILAARFLNRFVPERSGWIHVDLAAGTRKGGLAHIPTEITGFGVRFTVELLQQGILERAGSVQQ